MPDALPLLRENVALNAPALPADSTASSEPDEHDELLQMDISSSSPYKVALRV